MVNIIKKFIVVVIAPLIIAISFILTPNIASAAACTNASNYGVATMTVNVPAAGDYRIWSRMKVPSSVASSYQLEVDGNTCWQVGGTNVPVNTWTWVDWSSGNSAQKVNYIFTAGNHTLKLIGSSVNVQVDKVILLGSGELCSDKGTTPTGDGTNCASAPAVTTTGSSGSGSITPVVAGTTTPTIVTSNQANATQTSYLVDGKVVQTSNGAAALDTTKLADGTYNVQTVVKLKDGTEVTDNQTITVKNHKTIFEKYRPALIVMTVAVVLIGVAYAAWRLFYRGDISILSEKFKNLTSKNEQPKQNSPQEQYSEPEIVKPTEKLPEDKQ